MPSQMQPFLDMLKSHPRLESRINWIASREHAALEETDLEAALYRKRASPRWRDRLFRLVQPPAPFIMNPAEPKDFPLGRWNLYIGGAGRVVEGYVNLDLFALPGVNVAADAEQLPFPADTFQRVECDAVLEHVRDPARVM